MAVSYKKLFRIMEETGFSANIITLMKSDSYISLESIERIF